MDEVFDEYLSEYAEVNNDAHRKAANLIGAPAVVWHQAFWHSSTDPAVRKTRAENVQSFIQTLHTHIGALPDSCIDPAHPDIVIKPNDRVRTLTFQFQWQHIQCKIRIEIHIEYVSITSIIDASINIAFGDDAAKLCYKDSSIYSKMQDSIDSFADFMAGEKDLSANALQKIHDFLYGGIWDSFFTEVLNVGNFFVADLNVVEATRVPIGLKFADFRGLITSETSPSDSEEGRKQRAKEESSWHDITAQELWGLDRKQIEKSFQSPPEIVRGQWRWMGYPGQAWARKRLNEAWPFLSLAGGTDLALLKGRTEFTVSRVFDGRMIYTSALGPQAEGRKAPIYFYVHSATQCERQIGRFIDRICQLGTNRLAAIMVLPYLSNTSDELWTIESNIQEARHKIDLLIQFAGNQPRKTIFPPSVITRMTNMELDILTILDKIQTSMSKISTGSDNIRQKELGNSSLEYRLLRSNYYRKNFQSLIPSLRLKRLEGYQPYDEFVSRRLGSAFGFIDGLERRINQIKEEWRAIDQLYLTTTITILNREIDQQNTTSARVQLEIKNLQLWGEIALWWILAPYYAIMVVDHLSNCEHDHWCENPTSLITPVNSLAHGQWSAIFILIVGVLIGAWRIFKNRKKSRR